MIASRPSVVAALCILFAGGGTVACRTPGARPVGAVLDRDVSFSPVAPDVADRTAARLAAASLASNREEAQRALRRLQAIDTVLEASGEPPTGLTPAARDLVNATLGDARAYRAATDELLSFSRLDPALEERLEQSRDDDPLRLAAARIRDARMIEFGRAFNALAEPLGRSMMTWSLAPMRLARGAVKYAVALYSKDPLPLQRRQALAHWQDFIDRYPDAPEVPALLPSVRSAEERLARTRRDKALRNAKQALARGKPRVALVYAKRALDQVPEDPRALAMQASASALLEREDEARRRSLTAPAAGAGTIEDGLSPEGLELARALLLPDGDVAGAAEALLAQRPQGPLTDEARFARALARGEAGDEQAHWNELEDLAGGDPLASNMARHAAARVASSSENPYRAYRSARRGERVTRGLWVLVGPYAQSTPHARLPRWLGWGIELPRIAQHIMSSPLRLLQLPWLPQMSPAKRAAQHARAYLDERPEGEHANELRDWLEGYEKKRGNWYGALRVAERGPNPDPEDLAELREKAAEQVSLAAAKQKRRDLRVAMYKEIARDFKDTAAGRSAGLMARHEIENATPHHIRLSRGFLVENPAVAGPEGLGLKPRLLDGDAANGELHPDGVSIIGGRMLELNFVGPSGDERHSPTRVVRSVSEERLARLVSQVEETQFRNSLVDSDDIVAHDAQRDVVFERARLGLADKIDSRSAAESNFAYIGIRERYGMVRAREPILPFDIVVSGSLSDFSLGAFPRMREPRQTPDAFLYK